MKTVKNKNKKNTTATAHDHPGRPRYTMVYPATLTFTFVELMNANGVDTRRALKNGDENPNYGRGENCTMLTVRKNLKHALANDDAFLMRGYTAVPDSNGLGRRGLLYRHQSTPFAKALVEAKVRGAEGLKDETPAPDVKVKAKVKAKAKTANKTRQTPGAAGVAKAIADAQAILNEPVATVQIAPVSAPVVPETPAAATEAPATSTLPVVDLNAPAAATEVVTPDMVINVEKATA